MIDPQLRGRVALVTGANQGIGAATAVALAAQGVAVFLTYKRLAPVRHPAYPEEYYRSRGAGADDVVRRIREAGGTAEAAEADLTDPETPRTLFDLAERALGPVDAESYDRQFAVDVRAATLLIAEFARRHIERRAGWGRIIGLTSGGPDGFPTEVSYGAAKAAQENFTMSAAHELGRYGVTAG
ncbi:SDR family NAD(P)-dependent oxidoreductase [Nonomuraea sp. NEAU-A123]|uniref:SDR family NAD(P)-dependent oxidoreductase n=1 Tax=Nonomuraea sp. NEAU-A123 TaxID=2839649 RepID=UPI001BE4D292|nr:SDR family NAD(P)-dependent oxidoreductase [Nonomuraea sp. NEAU-A123]MBT2235122.1 SDR family NAD(P)-dependent oxidoreductase [Nonomuraea sp. NEAU-A123]